MTFKIKSFVLAHPLLCLAALGLAVFGVHSMTVADYPTGWFDEIEIIEMGRFSVFDICPNWSVNLFPATDGLLHPPAPMFHYLSGFVQEALYRAFGSFLPSRLFFLLSLPVVSLSLFAWLRTKGVSVLAALLAAALLLLDPNATICAHWYRPDLWTTSLAFAAMILLAATRNALPRRRLAACFVAGFLSATMLFFWITSMLLLPLISWEALQSCRDVSRRTLVRDAVAFFVGAILAVAVFLIPLYPHIPAIVAQYAEHSELGRGGDSVGFVRRLADFVKIAGRSPFVWSFAGLGVVIAARKRAVHALVFFGLCLLMLNTHVYHLRMLQLLPFLFLFAAVAIERALRFKGKFPSRSVTAVLSLSVLAHCLLSVVALNYAAIPSGNTFAALTERLRSALPTKSPKVYLYDMEHELYYSGRALGWQMYSFAPRKTVFDSSLSASLLDRLDAVVVSAAAKESLTAADVGRLRQKGFTHVSSVELPRKKGGRLQELLRNLFYAHGYPNCTIYSRRP